VLKIFQHEKLLLQPVGIAEYWQDDRIEKGFRALKPGTLFAFDAILKHVRHRSSLPENASLQTGKSGRQSAKDTHKNN